MIYLIIKEIASTIRAKHTFAKGFRQGIEAATPIFEDMKYKLELAAEADALDATLYIRGRIHVPPK